MIDGAFAGKMVPLSSEPVTNVELARALSELALRLEVDGVRFKPGAYERAAEAIERLAVPLYDVYANGGVIALAAVPGVTQAIARRVAELLERGRSAELDALRVETPVELRELTSLEGVGPRAVHALWRKLRVRTVEDLGRAARQGRLHELEHFGPRSRERVLLAIELRGRQRDRRPLADVWPLARRVQQELLEVPGISRVALAGSMRRRRATVSDIDLVVATRQPDDVTSVFVAFPEVHAVLARGPTKVLVSLLGGVEADLRVVRPESFGAALLYFTGSRAHNVALRRIAQDLRLTLSEHGLFRADRRIASRTEHEIYRALRVAWIPPDKRDGAWAVACARLR